MVMVLHKGLYVAGLFLSCAGAVFHVMISMLSLVLLFNVHPTHGHLNSVININRYGS